MPKSKSMCSGCHDNYYNRTEEGGCWSYKTAKVVNRVRVGTWEPPPYAKERVAKYLSCFHCQGYSFLPLDDSRVKPRKAIEKERNHAD